MYNIVIRLEARLQPNIGFTLWHVLAVFTHLAITLPKVNWFGWNLEHSEYIVGGWPWHILGMIRPFTSCTTRHVITLTVWVGVTWWRRSVVKTAANQNGKSQNNDMPEQRQTVNDVTTCATTQIPVLYCGHSTQYSHLVWCLCWAAC